MQNLLPRLIIRSFPFSIILVFFVLINTRGQSGYSEAPGAPLSSPTFPNVAAGLGGISYYTTYSPFADALKASTWINVATWDEQGYPASPQPNEVVKARMGVDNGSTWPSGHYTLTWQGEADAVKLIQPSDAVLVSEALSGTVKKRIYQVSPRNYGLEIQVDRYPATDIHLYLPGLADHSSLWNPEYLAYLRPFRGKLLRYMDYGPTNFSEQENWTDRTPRNWSSYANRNRDSGSWTTKAEVSWEAMIELSNELKVDMWICLPHRATDDYIRNLAHLIKTGVDLATGEQTTQPLRPELRVFLEYSNEVWNWSFAGEYGQTSWVDTHVEGANLDEKYTRKAVATMKTFKTAFNDDDRLVRVLATQTTSGNSVYSRTYQRMATANYPEDYDALAITTYFRYDYHRWIYDKWSNEGQLATDEELADYLLAEIGEGPFQENDLNAHNEGVYWTYWAARQFGVPVIAYEGNEHLNATRRVVDTNGDGVVNNQDQELQALVPGSEMLIQDMARSPRVAKLLTAYQKRSEASGLQMFNAFVLLNGWSKHGQWGFAEYVGQPVQEATKYEWLLNYFGLPYPESDVTLVIGQLSSNYQEGDTVVLTATARDNQVRLKNLQFYYADGTPADGQLAYANDTFRFVINNLTTGSYTLYARAQEEKDFLVGSNRVVVTVAPTPTDTGSPNQPPSVGFITPAPGRRMLLGDQLAIALQAQDADGTIAQLVVMADEDTIAVLTEAPYQLNWTPPQTGTYRLVAWAWDDQETQGEPAITTLLVNNPPIDRPKVIEEPEPETLSEVLFGPNLLTPNGDGRNDLWVISEAPSEVQCRVWVYDRAGRMVFWDANYKNDWAGVSQGSLLPEGVYYYRVVRGQEATVGYLTLLRP